MRIVRFFQCDHSKTRLHAPLIFIRMKAKPFVCLIVMSAVGLALTACATTTSPAFEIGLIGDAPYSPSQEKRLQEVIKHMNREKLEFVFHVGDLQVSGPGYREGIPPCTDEALTNVRTLLDRSMHPVIITPGDNDWTDCHATKPPADPLERLRRVRDAFFAAGKPALGGRSLAVKSQPAENDSPAFPENLLWTRGDVLFVTLHIVGSNNNLGRTPEGDAEYRVRNGAAIRWMRHAFTLAKSQSSKAVMIFAHANPSFEDRWPRFYVRILRIAPPSPDPTGFTEFLAALEEEVTAYGRPVVLAHGDTHYFRVDKPFFRAGNGELIANFTRVETYGSPYVHWVRVGIDTSTEAVFTFRPEVVP